MCQRSSSWRNFDEGESGTVEDDDIQNIEYIGYESDDDDGDDNDYHDDKILSSLDDVGSRTVELATHFKEVDIGF